MYPLRAALTTSLERVRQYFPLGAGGCFVHSSFRLMDMGFLEHAEHLRGRFIVPKTQECSSYGCRG